MNNIEFLRYLLHHSHDVGCVSCPVCGRVLEMATSFASKPGEEAKGPEDGCLNVCAGCTTYLIFTDGATKLRRLTDEEFAALDDEGRNTLQMFREMLHTVQQREGTGQ